MFDENLKIHNTLIKIQQNITDYNIPHIKKYIKNFILYIFITPQVTFLFINSYQTFFTV